MAADGPQVRAGARLLHSRQWQQHLQNGHQMRYLEWAPVGYSATRQAARPRASGRATSTPAVAGMCAPKHGIQAFKHGREIFSMMLGI
jgi:hypothetical protein